MSGFRQALHQAGYVEGRNLLIDFRAAGVADDQLSRAAAALVAAKVDIIVVAGTSNAVSVAKRATATIPIVMAISLPDQSLKIVMDPKTIMDPWRVSHLRAEKFR